eukprot:CAMPEP_0206574568 /NCGR_PEP_ID=MMETSP0325_2-20121206/29531_1 /ASSEMBLY_ACC=CAM_ASM_000347 /TAXON_ID=2866 /ORGANISM="Crypthecodinium cohnii, Strain Seligo" /LENGTH=32 /DNA_ID= /DNA_START= /DNA_END= /DNA_ORIENTATION=
MAQQERRFVNNGNGNGNGGVCKEKQTLGVPGK